MNVVELPLLAGNQVFDIQLGGIEYRMRILYRGIAGWTLDIMHPNSEPIVLGTPLVSGVDILEPHQYLGFNGALVFICKDGNESNGEGLGDTKRLYFIAY
ncbi:phage baseplate plug family protein [Xenorhabdus bovienii]|uniref:phage baseplate plug family protein n=1 Tax=Xenorhabdus bovienii TaxID=40576 RepID=UPI0023B2BE23|nr:hypothetical protein [Xenorhabdus bovienii]MDE9456122.1 hypothetical protein [Xenorhabdus bovienii]